MRVWWFVVLAGCYSVAPQAGVPCDPTTPNCPTGQLCVRRGGGFVCDSEPGDPDASGGGEIATSNDMDGDGIPNATDNCPAKPNTNQANEDGDATGDVCDKCPPYPDVGNDGDSDGVGDVCDPHLLIPGDAITFFEGFSGNALPTGWTAVGDWSVSGGNLLSVAKDNNLSTLVVPYASTPNQTIYANATITALTQTTGGSIGVADRFDGTSGVHCGGGRSATPGLFALINAASGGFLAQTAHPFEVGTLYRLTMTSAGQSYTCSTIQIGGSPTSVTSQYDTGGPNIGFRNRVASASFAWLLVVKSP